MPEETHDPERLVREVTFAVEGPSAPLVVPILLVPIRIVPPLIVLPPVKVFVPLNVCVPVLVKLRFGTSTML